LLERDAELAVARLQLREEPDVLDGDDGLVGECLQQRDLALGKELDLGAAKLNRADGHAVPHQRHAEDRPVSHSPCVLTAFRKFLGLGLDVRDVESPPVEDRSPIARSANQRKRRMARERAAMSDEAQAVAVPAEDADIGYTAEASRALGDGVEDR